MKQLIERLRELEASLSPAPWVGHNHPSYVNEMRNALPQLLDRLEKLEAVYTTGLGLHGLDESLGSDKAFMDALAALEDKP